VRSVDSREPRELPVLGHLRAQMIDRFEIDFLRCFASTDSTLPLDRARRHWTAIRESERAPDTAVLRQVLFTDIVEMLGELQSTPR
jgi:hypothetical protein